MRKVVFMSQILMQRATRIFITTIIIVSGIVVFHGGVVQAAERQWAAEIVSQSYEKIYIKPEADITVTVGFKNTGTREWHNKRALKGYVALNVRKKSMFEHRFWEDWEHPCRIKEESVAPGETATCRFAFRAPSALGNYNLKTELAAEDVAWIEGGEFNLSVIVTLDPKGDKARDDAKLEKARATAKTESKESEKTEERIAIVQTIPEPLDFRVGLFYRDDPLKLTNWGTFHMTDPNGNVIQTFGGGSIVTVQYDRNTNIYSVTTPAGTTNYRHYIRFVPAERNPSKIFELSNYSNHPSWDPSINENKYRGIIECRYNPRTGNIWAINELPLEEYMKGIGEIGEKAPMDALKASAIAARGYALDLYQKNSKYYGFIHAITTQADQLYGGYEQEKRRPNFLKALESTRGIVVTYEEKPVVTPYFSQSKGETRSSQEVWGGPAKPWLVRVSVPCDIGQRGIGHGVGMSQQASICMAQQGMTYEQILKHFYTGVELAKVY